jgi:hypothetical protein
VALIFYLKVLAFSGKSGLRNRPLRAAHPPPSPHFRRN